MIPLRWNSGKLKLDLRLIAQIYNNVKEDLNKGCFHIDLSVIPRDEMLHGYIVENLLNYQKYYADCRFKSYGDDSMKQLLVSGVS